MIRNVILHPLKTRTDERGYFRELIRATDDFFREGFGQWSMSLMHQGVVKAWHIHKVQTDWWYVVRGVLKVALHDTRPDSPTHRATEEFLLGDNHPPAILTIPPGVAHGCRVLDGPATLFYVTSKIHDPKDEGRIPHDDPTIGYNWLKGPAIS